MKGTVNPFEPWRPVEVRIPPPLHVGRPWRPPIPLPVRATVEDVPFVEPVHPSPRNKPPEKAKRPQGQGRSPASRRVPISQWAVFVAFTVLAILCLQSVGWYTGSHTPRLAVLGLSGGLFAAMAFPNPHRNWYARLRGMAMSLALAGIALWFVPTVHGINLWSAYRQVEALRSLPAGNIAEYQRGRAARRTLVEEYPSFAVDVSAAEQSWLRRTVEEAIEKADRQLKTDAHAALAYLQKLDKELSQVQYYASVRKDLDNARRRVLQACAKAVRREADDLRVKKQ